MKSKLMRFLILFITIILTLNTSSIYSQIDRVNQNFDPLEAESHLRFLTSDELKGRDTGSEELIIAGRYIAEQFRKSKVKPLGDEEGEYQQKVPLELTTKASEAMVKMLGVDLNIDAGDLVVLSGNNGDLNAPLIYLEDPGALSSVDVSGKVVISVLHDLRQAAAHSMDDLKAAGAVGYVQLYGPGQQYPWPLIQNFFSRERMALKEKTENEEPEEKDESFFPHIWIRDTAKVYVQQLIDTPDSEVAIKVSGISTTEVKAFNIVGKIEGTDPELKKEHIVMTAHYDHVGIQITEEEDSIYNGTRDNGIGTTGIINAANYFGKYPPKRSIIFIALTAEEKGLLGSRYYASNPKIPLEETVFNLNIDNSGYTDTHVITLLDTNRTNIDELVYQAANEVGLGVIGDRIPDQNYYERSDQFSFASKGVPAVNFKMAMSAFDERITEYYHRPSDEFDTVDLDYIHKYWKAYIRSAELIGNWDQKPWWIEGDKFEAAGKELYGNIE